MIAKYVWEHDDREWEIQIEFKVIRGHPMTFDYPGDPDEVDFIVFTCKENPAIAEVFSNLVVYGSDLHAEVENECFAVAEAMWELSQCDD